MASGSKLPIVRAIRLLFAKLLCDTVPVVSARNLLDMCMGITAGNKAQELGGCCAWGATLMCCQGCSCMCGYQP